MHNRGYNQGYNARYNIQRVKYNNPILDSHQEEPIQPAFNSVPAVPTILANSSPQESSILPEPIFAAEKIQTAVTHADNVHPIAAPVADSSGMP